MERTPHELVKPSLSQTVKGTDAAREGLNAHYPRSATYANKPARGKINFPGLVGSAAPNHRKVLERPRRPKKTASLFQTAGLIFMRTGHAKVGESYTHSYTPQHIVGDSFTYHTIQ